MTYARNFDLLNSKFKEMFFPTLFASIAGNFAILLDAFIISLFMGAMNLSVIQSIEPLAQFINMVYWLIGFGGSILCTTARAEFKKKKANELFTISVVGVLIISIAITLIGIIFPDQIVHVLCSSSQLKPLVMEYFRLYNYSIPFQCYLVVMAYFIKTDDFINLQFKSYLTANVINVVLDVVFIKFFGLGVGGAALATTIGYLIASIYISTYFLSSKRTLKMVKFKLSKSFQYIKDISKTGFSTCSIPLYNTLRLLVLNSLVLGLMEQVGLAAFNMCYNVLFLVGIFVFGTAQSLLPIIAVYFQEGDYTGVNYVSKRSLKLVVAFGIFFTALFVIFPQSILYLFSVKNPADIPIVMNAIRIFSLCILGYSINFLYIFYAQSVQYTKLANIVTLLEGLILPILFAYLFCYLWGAEAFWISVVVAEFATVLFIYIYSKYMTKKSNGEYSGFFLGKHEEEGRVLEYTLEGNVDDAVNLSRNVQEFITDSRLSILVSLAIEEMIVYIINLNKEKLDWIDVIVRDNENSMLISIKHSGLGFNPENNEEVKSDNIDMLKGISEKIDYSQILGLNNTVITIKK